MTGTPARATGWVATDRSAHLRGRRSRDTEPELLLRRALHAAGARFRLHRRLAPGCRPDLLLPRHRLAVFVDGDFWHGCPEHGPRAFSGPNAQLWRDKLERNRQRDDQATRLAHGQDWTVVRLWECQVRADPAAAARLVLTRSRAATSGPSGAAA